MANKEIKISWNETNQEYDINFEDGDFENENGLTTAVLISLFTDRRATSDDDLDDPEDLRGWWGDQVSEFEDDQIGSKLWLLKRASTTEKNVQKYKKFTEEALAWMVDDGVAKNIEVIATRLAYPDDDTICLDIKIFRYDGNVITYKFDDLWEAQISET
jgi:phage gp46-like protein